MNPRISIFLTLFLGIGLSIVTNFPAYAKTTPLAFAASSLAAPLGQIAKRYRDQSGQEIDLVFASSGALARQIANGAPARFFISANQRWTDWLKDRDLLVHNSIKPFLENRLVLISHARYASGTTLRSALNELPARNKIALADPAHVPAGIYAREALISLGLWKVVHTRLARTRDVRAALVLVERGEAPLGIVYRTDARSSRSVKTIAVIPENSHSPIRYSIGMVKRAKPTKDAAFYEFLLSNQALAIWSEHGFILP